MAILGSARAGVKTGRYPGAPSSAPGSSVPDAGVPQQPPWVPILPADLLTAESPWRLPFFAADFVPDVGSARDACAPYDPFRQTMTYSDEPPKQL